MSCGWQPEVAQGPATVPQDRWYLRIFRYRPPDSGEVREGLRVLPQNHRRARKSGDRCKRRLRTPKENPIEAPYELTVPFGLTADDDILSWMASTATRLLPKRLHNLRVNLRFWRARVCGRPCDGLPRRKFVPIHRGAVNEPRPVAWDWRAIAHREGLELVVRQ